MFLLFNLCQKLKIINANISFGTFMIVLPCQFVCLCVSSAIFIAVLPLSFVCCIHGSAALMCCSYILCAILMAMPSLNPVKMIVFRSKRENWDICYCENFKITYHKYQFWIMKSIAFLADIGYSVRLLSNRENRFNCYSI